MTVKDVDEVGGTIPVPIADWKAKQSRTNIREVIRSIVMVKGAVRRTVSCNSLGGDEGCRGDCTQQLLHVALPFKYLVGEIKVKRIQPKLSETISIVTNRGIVNAFCA